MRQLSYLRHGSHSDYLVGALTDDDPGVRLVGGASGDRQRCGQGAHGITAVVQAAAHRVAAVLLRVVAIRFAAAGEPLEGRKAAKEWVWGIE